MSGLFAFWMLTGWCGTPWPGWWKGPKPDPTPWWIIKILGVIGGVAGGWLFYQVWPPEQMTITGIYVAATGVGAYVGSAFLSDIYGLIKGRSSDVAV